MERFVGMIDGRDEANNRWGADLMRLFIAICFDDNMLDSLAEIQDDLRRCGVKGSYTPRENLHMTLAFIGEYDDPEQVVEVMQKVPLRFGTAYLLCCMFNCINRFSMLCKPVTKIIGGKKLFYLFIDHFWSEILEFYSKMRHPI